MEPRSTVWKARALAPKAEPCVSLVGIQRRLFSQFKVICPVKKSHLHWELDGKEWSSKARNLEMLRKTRKSSTHKGFRVLQVYFLLCLKLPKVSFDPTAVTKSVKKIKFNQEFWRSENPTLCDDSQIISTPSNKQKTVLKSYTEWKIFIQMGRLRRLLTKRKELFLEGYLSSDDLEIPEIPFLSQFETLSVAIHFLP